MKYLTISEKLKSLEWYLILFITLVTLVGFAALYSAAGGKMSPWANKQALRFCLGFFLMISIALVDVRVWRTYSYILYGLSLCLLIFVEIKGHIGMGAQRWIDMHIFNLQPSEVMKVTLVMALAHYFHTKTDEEILKLKTYLFPLILIAIPSLLVLRQPDLGTMIILAATGSIVIFMVGVRVWKIVLCMLTSLAALPILWMNMHTYQKKRILTFLDPEKDPLGSGYHILQSKISIGSGGIFGKLFLHGSQSQLQFLPEKQTDFIFAHFCEEFGVLGGMALMILYGLIVLTAFKMTLECRSLYSRLYGVGFTSLFFFYVFINMAMVMGMIPVVGVPLPFMSYGGTSMLSLLMGFGLLLSCYIHRHVRFGRNY